jgi:hypothetical protein
MHTDSPLGSLSPHQYTLLMERAKRDALRLRHEAIAAFWSDLARAARQASRGLLRHARTPIAPTLTTGKPIPCQH